MRQIKFRVWNGKGKIMYDPECIGLLMHLNGELNIEREEGRLAGTYHTEQLGLRLLQFTGVTDCNEKEIYEGDIVEFSISYLDGATRIAKANVCWCDECLRWVVTTSDNFEYELCEIYEIKVLGNIYENPELMSAQIMYCDNCEYLQPKENEQSNKKEDHVCNITGQRITHNRQHPHLPSPENCPKRKK